MSSVLQGGLAGAQRRWVPWLAIAAALLVLYVPVYVGLARTLWRDEAYAHGPIVLAVFGWLAWRGRAALVEEGGQPSVAWGAALLALGLALYIVGRSQAIALFAVASHIPLLAGIVLLVRGPRALRRYAFALGFLVFLVPLPGFILDGLTAPLKVLASSAVQVILQAGGYSVERDGVVLVAGGHQMLVADACSGLNTVYSLLAMTLLYLYLTGPSRRARIALLVAAVVPIAVAANIVRVLALVLVTMYAGEEAAQGALHGFAGLLVFVLALAMLVGVDALSRVYLGPRIREDDGQSGRHTRRDAISPTERTCVNERTASTTLAVIACVSILGAAVAAPVLKPVRAEGPAIALDAMIPATFGDWHIDPQGVPIAPAPDVQAKLDRIYEQVVSRTYVNATGERMMLTVAYGGDQSDALKAHRQEACYAAQGFDIHALEHRPLTVGGRSIPVTRMIAVRGERVEPVTYWLTMGDRVVLGRLERLRTQVASGLAGHIPDGMLVRVSSLSEDSASAYAAQRDFAAALVAAMAPGDAARLAGRVPG